MNRLPPVLAVAILLLTAGAAGAQPRSDAEGADYFPLVKGTKWVYTVGSTEITTTVVGTEQLGNETCVKVTTQAGGGGAGSADWYARRPGGVFRVKTQSGDVDPPVLVVPAAIRIGDSWPVEVTSGGQTAKGTMHLRKSEKVKTPAGEFDAILVESVDLELAGTAATMRMWYARNVGMVKTEFVVGGQTITLELSKFEPPKP